MLNKSTFFRILQILIATAILMILFYHIDIHKIEMLIRQAKPTYIFLAFIVLATQIIVAAYRWLLIIRIAGFFPSVWQCVGSFAAGSFINTALPGGVGGDIVRMWVTARHGVPSGVAVNTVILDRILNLVGLGAPLAILLLTCMLLKNLVLDGIDLFAMGLGLSLLCAFVALILIAPSVSRFNINLPLILTPFVKLSRLTNLIFQHSQQMVVLFGMILLGYILQISAMILLINGFEISLPIQVTLISIPIVLLLSAIPITPGGWGVRESTMVLVLNQYQIPAEAALSVSILFGVTSAFASLPIGAWWFMHKNAASKPISKPAAEKTHTLLNYEEAPE